MSIFQKHAPKELITSGIIALIASFNIIMLTFNLVTIRVSFMGSVLTTSASGFSVMWNGYPEILEKIGEWLQIYSLLHFALAIMCLAYLIYLFFIKKNFVIFLMTAQKVNVFSCIMAMAYAINGVITVAIADNELEGWGETGTSAFIPLIITSLLIASLYAAKKYIPDNFLIDQNVATIEDIAE